ncbi:group XIIA secretory phospholipase A2 [Folsomia candida]|uniref:group XIIA secretory phospholipase A2 n=1 Tax=Folsomia candida TaxID=158441 RepID=UPI000B8F24B9|nr:group XIIA secretory phospholipase A2 [Folsomia candida]
MSKLFLFLTAVLIFFNLTSDVEGCTWCSGGTRIPSGNRPTKNGCGSGWESQVLNRLVTPRTIACCNSHDFCYNDCSKTKAICDNEFSNCLKNICDNYRSEGICIRGIMNFFVDKLGCSKYQGAQAEGCRCQARTGK